MAVKLVIPLLDPDGAISAGGYAAGAVIQVQRAVDEAFTVPADVSEVTIVAGTYHYVAWDATGDRSYWYRWRLENSGDTETGEWSDPFQGWDPALPGRLSGSYANPDEVLIRYGAEPTERQTRKLARIDIALRDANDRLTDELDGLSFFRSPATGVTEVRTFDGDGCAVLHVHGGIVALDAVRVKLSTDGDWVDVADGDWRLEYWANRGAPHTLPAGEPYDHLVLTGIGTQRSWPKVAAGVELTGAFNWPRPPRVAINAEIELARQALALDPSFAGGQVGPPELGRPQAPTMLPRAVYDLASRMSRRFFCDL